VIETLPGFAAIFALALLRVPLAMSMGVVGLAGITYVRGWEPALASTAQVVYETGFAYTLSVIPLFILMGNFVARPAWPMNCFKPPMPLSAIFVVAWRMPPWLPAPALAPSVAHRLPPLPL